MLSNISENLSQLKENKFYQVILTVIIILGYILMGEYLPVGSYSTFVGAAITILVIYFWGKLEGETFVENSLTRPENWGKEWLGALLKTILILLISLFIFLPLIDTIIGQTPDYSDFKILEGNLSFLLIQLVLVWTIIAFGEEIIFRGFLMSRIKKVVGEQATGRVLNVLISSVLFGFLHSYQGLSGQVFTGMIGVLLACNFIYKEYNLWENIFIHGFVNTVAMILFFLGWYP